MLAAVKKGCRCVYGREQTKCTENQYGEVSVQIKHRLLQAAILNVTTKVQKADFQGSKFMRGAKRRK